MEQAAQRGRKPWRRPASRRGDGGPRASCSDVEPEPRFSGLRNSVFGANGSRRIVFQNDLTEARFVCEANRSDGRDRLTLAKNSRSSSEAARTSGESCPLCQRRLPRYASTVFCKPSWSDV